MPSGALTVVGTGIRLITQITLEARAAIQDAEKVFYTADGPVQRRWLEQLNPTAESLEHLYQLGRDRLSTYDEMVERALSEARSGVRVCLVMYGHPGVLVTPAHEAIRRARAEGIRATMLPGVSAEDCLFADLGLDPGARGCQTFEATDFLVQRRRFDPRSALVLYQIAAIGIRAHTLALPNIHGLRALTAALVAHYPSEHEAIVYTAAEYPGCPPLLTPTTLDALPEATVLPTSTLYVPPLDEAPADPDAYLALVSP
ncbi:SAM-dependent methyltransferase [Chondromyces apiculatus]|uniref:Uroporphyrin-III C/tetrapyrrole (Corrin/Porphyrin) methyltransferase n=1 Tax=Chondromyces apiculatus DSM 436 TaxID=1192034 RepID=A0A017TI19_9BACT|nr:SAM-dependent methyltransferase [Chondromyces apiculatus]EYF08899.1 Uroporphyrin-III C/tetrapyrrole (Corrin/Porphyrin) methyltransferase [Chondromyces apiculatus DSM 436]